jgi:cyanophycin synthetase
VITNIGADHTGQNGLETIDEIMPVKSVVADQVRTGGTLVLNMGDERVRTFI